MKRYILGLCLLSSSMIVFCQEQKPEYDTTTNNITKFSTQYKDEYAQSIVNIQAGSESGQGLLVGTNLVLTSYSLIAGKSNVSYVDVSGRTKYFDGYIAADPARGIILLKTADVYSKFIDLFHTSYNASQDTYEQSLFLMHKDGNRYIIDKAVLPRIESKGHYITNAYILRKVNYTGAKPIQGYIDFSYTLAGIIVYINGEPFHVNNRLLYELLLHKDLAPVNLADLPSQSAGTNNQQSKPSIYKIGLNTESSGETSTVTLDYVKRDQQKLSLYFTFKANPSHSKGSSFKPILSLIDLKSGIIYHPSSTENIPTFVYNTTSSRGAIHYENIPASVNQVKLRTLPIDVYDLHKTRLELRYQFYDKYFEKVIIYNFPTTKKTHYALDEDFTDGGTVSFYCLKSSSNMTGDVRISIDGDAVGTLTRYYTDLNTKDFCGESASITVKLKPGEYKYKAVMGGNKIERKFKVTKGNCSAQLIKF